MKTITEPTRQIPVVAQADVIVAGGGPGGLPAAIAAARHGAKVLLIERYGFMGGLATAWTSIRLPNPSAYLPVFARPPCRSPSRVIWSISSGRHHRWYPVAPAGTSAETSTGTQLPVPLWL